jgi:hypothetical protein
MNNKAEGTITTFLITTILVIGGLMLVSTLVLNLTKNYGISNIEEFSEYDDIFLELNQTTREFIKSQDAIDTQNTTSNWILRAKDTVETYWENSILNRAWSTISLFPKLIKFTSKSVNIALSQTGINIPSYMKWLIITLIGITLIMLIVKAIWEKKI